MTKALELPFLVTYSADSLKHNSVSKKQALTAPWHNSGILEQIWTFSNFKLNL